jgi:lipopolysaccharide transport system ATP-binding protein
VIALEAKNLTKVYPLGGSPWSRLRHALARGVGLSGIRALSDVSFQVNRGEAFGIVGTNGSGKSTLLQIVAGILRPTSGEVQVNGRLSALLELGSGFSPEFSGRQNVFLNASILGLTQEEIAERFEAIENFASIGDFIDQPIRTYSSGMVLRLAFAVVAHVDPEVLIVDEALAVGDIAFRQRCMRRIHDLRAKGVTILFVSHDTSDVKALCERCLWLERGQVRLLGSADDVIGAYLSSSIQRDAAPEKADRAVRAIHAVASTPDSFSGKHRFGNGRAAVTDVKLLSPEGIPVTEWHAGSLVVIRLNWKALEDVEAPIAGYLVRNEKGETIFGTNTARENHPVPPLAAGEGDTVDFHLTLPELAPGRYFISAAISEGTRDVFAVCDYIEDALSLATPPDARPLTGYMRLKCETVIVHRHGV